MMSMHSSDDDAMPMVIANYDKRIAITVTTYVAIGAAPTKSQRIYMHVDLHHLYGQEPNYRIYYIVFLAI